MGGVIDLISSDAISGKIAKDLFEIVYTEGGDPAEIVEAKGMKQVTDLGPIQAALDEIIAANPDQVTKALENPKLAGWFVGQVMKATGGKANPKAVNELVAKTLKELRVSLPKPLSNFIKRQNNLPLDCVLTAARTNIFIVVKWARENSWNSNPLAHSNFQPSIVPNSETKK